MNPKEYGRIVRFQRALRIMQLGSRDYTGIAYATGYADPSHFLFQVYAPPKNRLGCNLLFIGALQPNFNMY